MLAYATCVLVVSCTRHDEECSASWTLKRVPDHRGSRIQHNAVTRSKILLDASHVNLNCTLDEIGNQLRHCLVLLQCKRGIRWEVDDFSNQLVIRKRHVQSYGLQCLLSSRSSHCGDLSGD